MPPRATPASPDAARAPKRSRGGAAALALVAVCLAALLPGQLALPPVDRDESRFAQASWQMASGDFPGDWVVPMVQDRPRLNKPPLIYWLQAACARLGGASGWPPEVAAPGPGERDASAPALTGDIGLFRIPSLLAAVVAALVTWRIGRTMFDPRAAWLAGALLGCSVMVVWDAHQARADQLLLLCTTLTQWALWRIWKQSDRGSSVWLVAAFWAALAAGVMAKGPITPMVAGLTALALSAATGRWRWMLATRPLLGLLIVGATVGPWVVAVADRVGWDFYLRTIFDETLGRTMQAKESHWGPPGYHLVLLPLFFWPGSLLTAIGVARALRIGWPRRERHGGALRRRPGRDAELFCLAWVVPAWIVFEISSTKLPHYTMPLYPALALLSARAVFAASVTGMRAGLRRTAAEARKTSSRVGFTVWLGLGGAVAVAAPLAAAHFGDAPRTAGVLAPLAAVSAAACVALFVAGRSLRANRFVAAQAAGIVTAVCASVAIFGVAAPELRAAWVSSRLARAFAIVDPLGARPLATSGYGEDSLLFLTRGRAERVREQDLRAWLREHPTGLAAVPNTADLGELRARVRGAVRGFNYSKGEWAHLLIVEALPPKSENAGAR